MEDALRFTITNILSFTAFLLVLYDSVQLEKNSVVRLKMARDIVSCLMYIIGGLYSALLGKLFSILRDFAVLRLKGDSHVERVALVAIAAAGIIFSAVTAYVSGSGWTDYLPTASITVSSCALVFCKTAKQLRVVYGLIALVIWLPYDFTNVLIGGVLQDLYQVMIPFAAKYVEADTGLLEQRNSQ